MVLDARFGVAKFGESFFNRVANVATDSVIDISLIGRAGTVSINSFNNQISLVGQLNNIRV